MGTQHEHSASTTSLLKDPVCGMDVDPSTTQHHVELDGHDHYFCSAGCRNAFEADPSSFLEPGHLSSHHHHDRRSRGPRTDRGSCRPRR